MTKSLSGARVKRVHPEDIKAAIRKTGITVTDLSVQLGYHRSAVTYCLRKPWPAVEEGIAGYLRTTPQALFPDRYDAAGHPLSFPASKRSRSRAARQRQ